MTKEVMTYNNITPAQVDLIKSQIAKGATDDELKLFLHVADKSGLDPLSRQIYFIKRSGKMTIQTGIDGFRAVADRTGQYVGSSDPVFEENGEIPSKATVTVNKVVGGIVGNFTATARWEEYYPGKSQGFMWNKMPHTMLGKCAEALALRKAFPAQLSGLYTDHEMDQANNDNEPNETPPKKTKEINPKGGSKQLEETLTEEAPKEYEATDFIKDDNDSSKLFEEAQSELDEAFAFCKNKEVHDNVINNLNDIKWEMSEANKEVLVNFATTYPANRERFQNVAKDKAKEWKKSMTSEDYNRLYDYMGELNTFFDMEVE